MSSGEINLAGTILSMRPILPAKDWEISPRFYKDLGFTPEMLRIDLIEMRLGAFSFILQCYYIKTWAENTVIHLRVSDLEMWWNRMSDVAKRYSVNIKEPAREDWGLVAGIVDPSGVLWRIAQG
jgi:hypothetical protein